jgi:drug/metabolite transporter (DMT)-like permease
MPAVASRRAYLALAAAGSLWGTGFLLGKIALRELDVPHMLFYRLSLAAIGFLPIVIARGGGIDRADWLRVLGAAVLGVPALFVLQFEGLARTTVSHAALMVGAAPIFLGLAAALFTKEQLTTRLWLLLGVSTGGALLIVFGSTAPAPGTPGPTVLGDLLVVVSLFAAVGWVLMSKALMQRYPSSLIAAVVMVSGTLILDAWVLATAGAPPLALSTRTWLALTAQGLLATTTATLLWNYGVARVPAAEAGVFVNLEPALGALLGVAILGETLGWSGLTGGTLIIGAAVMAARQAR